MNLDSLVIDREDAKERLAEYEQALRGERNVEDEAIAAGYRAASRGLPVISLQQTITAGGFHDSNMPRLAIARADTKVCYCSMSGSRSNPLTIEFRDSQWGQSRGALVGTHHVTVRNIPAPPGDVPWRTGQTMVPSIPPKHRPKRHHRLRNFHILWEVESWTLMPPKDPALLRHIRGDLWSVLAVWDLTELERAVLSQRMSEA